MNLLVHAGAGALIAQYTGSPTLAFIYGVLGHFFLDIIPHGDSQLYQRYKRKEVSPKKVMALTIIDAVTTVIFIVVYFNLDLYKSLLISSMAIVGSIIPDILIGFYEVLDPNAPRWLKFVHKWHFKNHDLIAQKWDFSLTGGLMMQALVFLLLIKIL